MTRREAIVLALDKLGHPTRLRILEACAQGPTSAKSIARDKRELGRVAYHVRAMAASKLIKRHSTVQIRGAMQTNYVISAPGLRLLDRLGLEDE